MSHAGSGLPCRKGCHQSFHPHRSPFQLSARTSEKFGVEAIAEAAARRNKHERDEHGYDHKQIATSKAGPFNAQDVDGFTPKHRKMVAA